MSEDDNYKPLLLKAIKMVLSDQKVIREEAISLKNKYIERYKEDRTIDEKAQLKAQ